MNFNVIVNVGNNEFAVGLTYVALSRVKSIEQLYFYPFPNKIRFDSIKKRKVFKDKLIQDAKEKEADAKFVEEFAKEFDIQDFI